MVSLSSTLMLQEEMSARVAITRNYQENMVRLWQLGLSPARSAALMPSTSDNAVLDQDIYGTRTLPGNPQIIETGVTTVNNVAMEGALCTAIVNLSQDPSNEIAGASHTLTAYRPRLITTLRIAPP